MANLKHILLVEDNPVFADAGLEVISKKSSKIVDGAVDYDSAIAVLGKGWYDSVISDCFFPRTLGSEDRTLGTQAIEKMLATDERGKKIEEYEKYVSDFMDLRDPELRRVIRYVGSLSKEKPIQSSVINIVKLVGAVDPKTISDILKMDASLIFRGIEHFKDHYDELRKALEKDPSNQPLGILIAEECQSRQIPFVLATSTYHHDVLTQPIQNYCQRKGWTLIDSSPNNPNEKATPEFWQRVYNGLEKVAGGSSQ